MSDNSWDLSQALESPESSPGRAENDASEKDQPQCDMQVEGRLHKAANLVLVLRRMTKPDLRSEFVMEECGQTEAPLVYQSAGGTFIRGSGPMECNLCDYEKKVLLRQHSQALQLQAAYLQDDMDGKKVTFFLDTYVNMQSPKATGQAVTLTMPARSSDRFCLSCTQSDSDPILQLERVSCQQLKSVHAEGDLVRFLFYRKETEFSTTTFESVRYPGWYIQSPETESEPVEMCKQKDVRNLFNVSRTY